MDMAMVLASGLKEVVVYEGGSTDTALAAMASDAAKCKQLSSSWSLGIEPRTVELLQQLTVQGQALSVASGDDGAVGDQGHVGRLPYVTVVGGTVLTGTAQDATPDVFEYTSEAPWANSGSFIADGTSGLPRVPIPGYQQGMSMTFCPSGMFCNGSIQYRNVPDIAMVSTQTQISFRGDRPDVNGTSLSSPLWAGWLAAANAYAKKNNLPPIGFPNPAIYAIGKTRGTAGDIYKDTFHDVVGGATSVFTPPCRPGHDCGPPSVASAAWPAVAGYDLASGWGSPTPKLIQALTTGLPPASPILDIASGWAHTCALKTDKTVACWGQNTFGQLGTGSVQTNSPAPLSVPGVSGIASVSAGFTFSCALEPLPSGKVYCWGSNDCGVLGTGDTTISYRMAPAQVMGLPLPAVAVTGGVSHACALLTDNSVYCWGCNFAGQLGNNGPPGQDATTPIKVASLSNVSAITAGQFHTCAIASGAPWCWGSNSEGQLGDGTTTVQRVPVRAAPTLTFDASNFVSNLSSGNGAGDHTCMVVHHAAAHDDLLCWGNDNASQLGDNGVLASQGADHSPTELLVQPIDANPLTVWSSSLPGGALASGNRLTCVIRSADHDATECWGNINAVAGPEQTLMTRTEVASLAGVKVSKVVAGFGHACVLLGSGEVRCWGQNGDGQVGDGVGVPFWSEPHKVNF
jgi:alpha-tubulin suppressor-like RCC1 family protein